jgi:hypothetical protein
MTPQPTTLIPLSQLLDFDTTATSATTICISLKKKSRPYVSISSNNERATFIPPNYPEHWYGVPLALCGDAPNQVHPKFLLAMLSSLPAQKANRREDGTLRALPEWQIPAIVFTTDEFVRRSMTLNGMRMVTEYFGSGSTRVLELVRQRLEADQRDVVHDVLVYLANQIIDVRAEAGEARMLRAEAVAAYLGLDQRRIEELFVSSQMHAPTLARAIQAGTAGTPRRTLDIAALIEGQVAILQPPLAAAAQAERVALRMIDRIVALLY